MTDVLDLTPDMARKAARYDRRRLAYSAWEAHRVQQLIAARLKMETAR